MKRNWITVNAKTINMRTTDCADDPPKSAPLKPSWNTLYTRVLVAPPGDPPVVVSMMPNVSKNA